MNAPVLLVVGAGPGVSGSVARRHARAGYDVGLVGRNAEALEELGSVLETDGVAAGWAVADVSDGDELRSAIQRLGEHRGRIDRLHFNPSAYRGKDPLQLTVAELLEDVALGVGGFLSAVQAARPFLSTGARITATGSAAADRPSAAAASLGVQKAGLRNLVHSVDQTLRPAGIRAVSVTVDGVLAPADPGSPFHPDRVAQALFDAAEQDEATWQSHLRHPSR